jgi:(p)ppGpp synthase/HD superfamily hydrolase
MSLQDKYRGLLETVAFAARAHHGQMRKDDKTPYVSHVFRACLVLRDVFGFDDPRMLITSLLHDTIEDTTTDFDDLEKDHGPEIASWVAALTKNKALRDEEREADYIKRLLAAPWQVQVCKVADVFDNLMDLKMQPPERRAHALARAESYLTALKKSSAKQVQKPLEMAGELLREVQKLS